MTRIIGVVLRARDKLSTVHFYASLGIVAEEHEHGGPKHYQLSPLSSDFVVEVYKQSVPFAGFALMIEVDSIAAALQAVRSFKIEPKTSIKEVGDMRFVYITDPDGKDVMLIERK